MEKNKLKNYDENKRFEMKDFKLYLYRFFRKFYVWYFRRRYALEKIRARKGKCKKCGACCYNFGMKCPLLFKGKHCYVRKYCQWIFGDGPLDEVQQVHQVKSSKGGQCGFYWEDKEIQKRKRKTNKSAKKARS